MELNLHEDSFNDSIANSPHGNPVPQGCLQDDISHIPQDKPPEAMEEYHEPASLADILVDATTALGSSADTGAQMMPSNLPLNETDGHNVISDAAAAQKAALARQKKAERAALKVDLDANFLSTFDPATSWLPLGSTEDDYNSPEFVAGLERLYWRGCGVGKAPMYGADMPGSLFSHNTGTSLVANPGAGALLKQKNKGVEGPIPWDVSNLPSALTRLLPRGMKIPGVNTPYLYFGMWRATFAWHVEDMDLFSINYLHWGVSSLFFSNPSLRSDSHFY